MCVCVCVTFKQKAALYVSTPFSALLTAITEYYFQYRLRFWLVLKANCFVYKKREVEKKASSVYTHSIHGGTVQQFVEPNVIVGSHFTNAYVTQVVRRGFDKGP